MTIGCNIWMICLILIWFFYGLSRMFPFPQFVWALRSSVWDVFINFLLIDATDRSKISSDQKRFFIALSLCPLSFFANTPFKLNSYNSRQDSLQGFQGVNQGIPVPRYPYLPQYQNPFRLYNQYPSQFNYQQQFQQEMTTTIMPTVKETVTEKSTTLKKLRIYSTTPTNLPEVSFAKMNSII